MYGPRGGPWYDGSRFKGHVVLVVPSIRKLLDPTIGQFSEVRDAGLADLPFLAELPAKASNLGAFPLVTRRPGHTLTYQPHPSARDGWHHGDLDEPGAVAEFARHGQDIACEVFNLCRQHRPEVIVESPHLRIRELGDALADATLLTDRSHGSRFVDASGAEIRLCDIP